jgi:hypothetical protein
MFLTGSSRLKRAVAAAVLAATVGSATAAAANDYPPVSADDGAGELVGPLATGDPELADLIQRLLEELGMAPDVAGGLVSDFVGDVSDRINAMVNEGLVTIEQVDVLREHVENGTFDEQIPDVADATRARRDAFHQAAREVLEELGIDVPDGVSIHEVLRNNDLNPSDLDDLLAERGIDLPPPPHGPTDLPPAPPPVAAPEHVTPPTPAAPSTTLPTADPAVHEMAPPPDYPTAPEPVPAEYPVRTPRQSTYPTTPESGTDASPPSCADGAGSGCETL